MISFNAREIYEMAEQIERNGAAFYRKAAEAAGDESVGRVLLELADMEDDHERTFAGMKARLEDAEPLDTVYDPHGEGARYLHAFIEGKIFDFTSDPAARLTGTEAPGEVFAAAIELEKDSILYYLTMKMMVLDIASRGRIDEIIEQEMDHIATLSEKSAAAN